MSAAVSGLVLATILQSPAAAGLLMSGFSAVSAITFGRGIEFRSWHKLEPGIGTEAWFCDPRTPWQKGSVENLNKRARRYLPRDTPVAALSNRSMKAICDRLNGTPGKCPGWRTLAEAFRDELMKLR
ncbi:hypothetical protein METH_22725 (plasmid) [Leisingera methylohalidivorans DSM 14336]|uniref:Integrase catalytic domain-containing protein n=1 Tax=Leisingera methylohalidivorans DSM 14336 TaxID=999552 RepID=V9W3B5_9RHOB|nr:hypothetical protein METH_22725 [Leisingera methylohalidivorans DSM 14336]